MIIEDTRNQKDKHKKKNSYFEKQGVKVVRSKLFVGDYCRLDDMSVCIDTKKDILEVGSNLCGSQHERFRNECIKAQNNGIKLIILVEDNFYNLDNLQEWESPVRKWGKLKGEPYSKIKGATLKKTMLTMEERYSVKFEFCRPANSGQKILELLKINTK